jgi:O-antigen/teichoic acid export membrane protein
MKELTKWQMISFISRMTAMGLGIVQSFVIIRILSVSEWGVVQMGLSIGGALGIYQHLGLSSASTREISSAKDDEDIFKIFVTSAFVRYCVTLPLAIGLFVFARYIAINLYSNPVLIFPLKLYSIVLVIQGVQGILNSVISGTKRFKTLFVYQVVIALVSVSLFIPLVYMFRIEGYFYALLLFTLISSIVLAVLAFRPLKGNLSLPTRKDFVRLLKDIFSISIGVYLVKIIYTNWEKLGPNLLGLANPAEVVAIYAFALLYAKKLMHISDSVTDVNLPVLSEKFVDSKAAFVKLFTENFNKVYSLIIFVAVTAVFWAPEVIHFVVGGNKYDASLVLVPALVFAFLFYSLINIVKSSVIIPAKMVKEMVIGYLALIIGTGVTYAVLATLLGHLQAMSLGMMVGGLS